jgi:CRISPR-associated protein Cas1
MKTGLYIQGRDEVLRLEGGALRIETEGGEKRDVPLENVEQLVLHERTTITGPALGELRERGIAVSYLDWRGRLHGRLEPHPSKNAVMRRAQVEAANDPARALQIGRWIVRAKLRNQRVFLMRHRRREGAEEELPESLVNDLQVLERRAGEAEGRDELMGIEGAGARLYFSGVGCLLEGTGFSWAGRTRRPPRDPVNAMMSYGYALLAGDCADAAAAAGLDPYVGFLHAERAGRAELALDLMEELRVVAVDALVLGLIRRKAVEPGGFRERGAEEGGGVEMGEEVRRRFLKAWAEAKKRSVKHPYLETLHEAGHFPLLQARLLGKHCAGLLPAYVPYLWR